MLKPIHPVPCSAALSACRGLQERLLAWLCAPATQPAMLLRANMPGPSLIEADWLWDFLNRDSAERPLLERATTLAGMSDAEKAALLAWGQIVAQVARQFQPNPPVWPTTRPTILPSAAWTGFKELMEGFYEKGLKSGLPYAADGTPVATGGVKYKDFVKAFRETHRHPEADPAAPDLCVLCGDTLGDTPDVDHWIAKHAFPLLSVCGYNLLPICHTCNKRPNKGDQAVFGPVGFQDWFHPYLRPGHAAVTLSYRLPGFEIVLTPHSPTDNARVQNLDRLLKLSKRWTTAFKAQRAEQWDTLRRLEKKRLRNGIPRHTAAEIQAHLENCRDGLPEYVPLYEIKKLLADALLVPARLSGLHTELGQVT